MNYSLMDHSGDNGLGLSGRHPSTSNQLIRLFYPWSKDSEELRFRRHTCTWSSHSADWATKPGMVANPSCGQLNDWSLYLSISAVVLHETCATSHHLAPLSNFQLLTPSGLFLMWLRLRWEQSPQVTQRRYTALSFLPGRWASEKEIDKDARDRRPFVWTGGYHPNVTWFDYGGVG